MHPILINVIFALFDDRWEATAEIRQSNIPQRLRLFHVKEFSQLQDHFGFN